MPGFDRTGPMGEGPMTGGGWGACNPSTRAYAGYSYGLGRGFRGGYGRNPRKCRGTGRRYGWQEAYPYPGRHYMPAYGASNAGPYTMRPEEEADMLRDELNAIKKRLEELESLSSAES